MESWYQDAHDSTVIEGNTLAFRDVATLLRDGRAVSDKQLKDHLNQSHAGISMVDNAAHVGFSAALVYREIEDADDLRPLLLAHRRQPAQGGHDARCILLREAKRLCDRTTDCWIHVLDERLGEDGVVCLPECRTLQHRGLVVSAPDVAVEDLIPQAPRQFQLRCGAYHVSTKSWVSESVNFSCRFRGRTLGACMTLCS